MSETQRLELMKRGAERKLERLRESLAAEERRLWTAAPGSHRPALPAPGDARRPKAAR